MSDDSTPPKRHAGAPQGVAWCAPIPLVEVKAVGKAR